MIASDGSATADRAARKGFDLARELLSSVTLVFIGHPSTGKLVMEDTIEVYGRGIETEMKLLQGDPADLILRTAEEVDADLVVVGNKGLQGAKGFLLGSVPRDGGRGRRPRRPAVPHGRCRSRRSSPPARAA